VWEKEGYAAMEKRQYQAGDSAAVTLQATTTTPYIPEPPC